MNIKDMWWAPFLPLPVWLLVILQGNWTPRFPRAWRGRKVTVVALGRTHPLKMGSIARNHFDNYTLGYDEVLGLPPRNFRFKDEGITWCVGWTGKHVDALKVTAVLDSSVLRS